MMRSFRQVREEGGHPHPPLRHYPGRSARLGQRTGTPTATAAERPNSIFASPYLAGAATVIRYANRSATSAQVRDTIVGQGTTGVVSNAGSGSPNILLYTGSLIPAA